MSAGRIVVFLWTGKSSASKKLMAKICSWIVNVFVGAFAILKEAFMWDKCNKIWQQHPLNQTHLDAVSTLSTTFEKNKQIFFRPVPRTWFKVVEFTLK